MSGVRWVSGDILRVDSLQLEQLKTDARNEPRQMARLCLHQGTEDRVHEMVIAFTRKAYVIPHRHLAKSESFHVIEGSLAVVFFDNDGDVTNRIELGVSGSERSFLYRLNTSLWHMALPLSEYVIIHEVTGGPLLSEDTEHPYWAPKESEPDRIGPFLERVSRIPGN